MEKSLDRILDSSSSTDNFAYLPSGEHTIQIPQPMLQTAITPSVRNDLIVGVIYLCILALEYKYSSASIDEEETPHQNKARPNLKFTIMMFIIRLMVITRMTVAPIGTKIHPNN